MYRIFNIVLDSQIPIPELAQVTDSQVVASFTFSLREDEVSDDSVTNWFYDWFDSNDEITLSAGRYKSNYWLRFPQLVDFEINPDEQTITAYRHICTSDATVRHLLLDQVIPRMLGQLGKFILHAGAVTMVNGKTVAFIGQSGWGKSTLVSSFLRQGAKLITDDCLMIEQGNGYVLAIPNYYGIRLFEDSIKAIFGEQKNTEDVAHYSSKRRLIMSDSSKAKVAAPLQLDAIFFLCDPRADSKPEEVRITTSGGMDAIMTLLAQTFVLDVTDTSLMARQFKNCGKIFDSKVSCFQLQYQRDHNILADVWSMINYVLE
mgnify:CR=1 FL=1